MKLPDIIERAAMQDAWNGGPGNGGSVAGTLHEWRIFELAWYSGRDWARAEMARHPRQKNKKQWEYLDCAHRPACHTGRECMARVMVCEDCGAYGHLECDQMPPDGERFR